MSRDAILQRTILAIPAPLLARRARAAETLEVLTADVRPLSIAEGPQRGFVLDIVAEAARMAGHEARFTFLPFAEALERTRATPGTLVAPLARSVPREAFFTWVGQVVDVPQAMGVRRGRPTPDLEQARSLARITAVRFILADKVHGVDSTRSEALPGESDMNWTRTVPHQNTVFRQVAKHIPMAELDRIIAEHKADKGVRKLPTKGMLLTLLFAQLAQSRDLRDIETVIQTHDARRYHSGLPVVRRSTLADAAAKRPAEVFTAILAELIARLTAKLPRGIGNCVRLIDSTTVPLSTLSSKWSRFSTRMCGAKAHIVYDPDANCPLYVSVTPARINDITAAKEMPIQPGATYVFDLGYYDFGWWAKLDAASCRIVTRLKANTPLQIIQTRAVPQAADHIVSDQIGLLPTDRHRQGVAHPDQRSARPGDRDRRVV